MCFVWQGVSPLEWVSLWDHLCEHNTWTSSRRLTDSKQKTLWSRTWCGLVGVSAAPHPHPAPPRLLPRLHSVRPACKQHQIWVMILRGKAVVAAFPVFLFQLKGRPGQELQCYRDLTFVPVSPILKIFLFSDGPPQPPSIPKYVSATNMLKDGYRGYILVHLQGHQEILLNCRYLWEPLKPFLRVWSPLFSTVYFQQFDLKVSHLTLCWKLSELQR